ncbi:TIGR00341 family protein [Selenomonas sp. TAMA-11512]|uniref:DUF389 domain-containing protein n=1 Tax=Selenomonas sp. TAMA-11512 TaxID=3095337 RepID=UPI00308579C2|nr:TIGR00341 family protein [Selenomonas sp. TAMA-11512]
MASIRKTLTALFDLRQDLAPMEEIEERIRSGGTLQGTNLCILILAIFIASVGLNMNSTAVIIGAMLISPLMGVILSIGYGMASYDVSYVKESLLKLSVQVGLSVLASAIYFLLTPIDTPSSELLARTTPTIWDVLIAIFGGLAGIIGITRVEKSNVIPGVAIATALMPPLCTAGYGIAVHSMPYALGALYLFFINSFFICLTAFFVLKVIGVRHCANVTEEVLYRQRIFLIACSVLIVIPSLFLAYRSVCENLENEQAKHFVEQGLGKHGPQVISYHLYPEQRLLEILMFGVPIPDEEADNLSAAMRHYSMLSDFELRILQNESGLAAEDLEELIERRLQENREAGTHAAKESELQLYRQRSRAYYPAYQDAKRVEEVRKALARKAHVLFPQIADVEVGRLISGGNQAVPAEGEAASPAEPPSADEAAAEERFMVIVYVREPIPAEEAGRLQRWLASEVNAAVVLNIQQVVRAGADPVSGNGIQWE